MNNEVKELIEKTRKTIFPQLDDDFITFVSHAEPSVVKTTLTIVNQLNSGRTVKDLKLDDFNAIDEKDHAEVCENVLNFAKKNARRFVELYHPVCVRVYQQTHVVDRDLASQFNDISFKILSVENRNREFQEEIVSVNCERA